MDVFGHVVKVLPLGSGAEAVNHYPALVSHFDSGGGPLMIGGGADVYSKTVIGVRMLPATPLPELLILDPHYDGPPAGGPAASVEALCKEGWAAWRPLSSCLRAESFYNIALPQRPQPDRPSARAVGVAHGQAAARATLVDAIPAPASASAFARTNADANAEQWGFEVIGEGFSDVS